MPNTAPEATRLIARSGLSLALAGFSLALVACAAGDGSGGGLIAPEGKASNDFLDRIDARCGKLSIGNQPLNYLLDENNNDVYFIDEASKLAAGEVDRATFTSDINAFYPTGRNDQALACIFAQLDGG